LLTGGVFESQAKQHIHELNDQEIKISQHFIAIIFQYEPQELFSLMVWFLLIYS